VPSEVLPDHRIVASRTCPGRVAFVRQLQRCELVVEFDADVEFHLRRFGHRVITYNGSNGATTAPAESRLGRCLIPN